MLRAVAYLLIAIVLITVLRSVIGVISKALGGALDSGSGRPVAKGPAAGGELKRDPVCGTYVSTSTSIKTTARGEVVYFCSAACRDKYRET